MERWRDAITEETARNRMHEFIASLPAEPGVSGSGRGIVICGGGLRYLTCAWVCIRMLRHLGCTLPIELWYLGSRELPPTAARLFEPHGVRCVDGLAMREVHPARILNGWELKPYAMIHSAFREVMALDADNVPVVDPRFLFDSPQYRADGAVFWPDYERLGSDRRIWELTGASYRDEPEFESGQIVVDKKRCARELALAMWMNEYSDFWYQHIHGDKDTFHLAWRTLGTPYAMPQRGIESLEGTMCQHDFSGRRIFQHRNMCKWSLEGNERIEGFVHEPLCLEFVRELAVHRRALVGLPDVDSTLTKNLAGQVFDYHRVGYDRRPMTFLPDGNIGEGAAAMERWWSVQNRSDGAILELYGDDGLTAQLRRQSGGERWCGRWVIHERMDLEISPLAAGGSRKMPQSLHECASR